MAALAGPIYRPELLARGRVKPAPAPGEVGGGPLA